MINPIATALSGLQNARNNIAETADRIAKGDVSVESMLDLQLGKRDFQAQSKSLSVVLELESKLLDIVA